MAVIYFLVAVFGIFVAGWLLHEITSSYSQMIDDLKRGLAEQSEKLSAQAKRLDELEQSAKKSRNPYLTNAGIEDAIAVALDVEQTAHYLDTRNRVLQSILRKIRTDPSGYDEDRPNGKKQIGGEE